MAQIDQATRIKILNVVLNHIYSHNWVNYDNFAEELVESVILEFSSGEWDLGRAVSRCALTFFKLNDLSIENFVTEGLSDRLVHSWAESVKASFPVLTFRDVFPEIVEISDREVKMVAEKLDVPELQIQQSLRDALREKGASPIAGRKKDTVLEIADLEHFYLDVKGRKLSFAVVVKGFRSLSKLNWESISHQLTKAYQTRPDYILLLSAKDPVDGVITLMTNYGESVGKKHLVILAPPLDVAKFLRCRKVI